MGETRQAQRLSHAASRCAAGSLAARSHLSRFLADNRGATAIEYGILIGVLSLALVTIFGNAQAILITTLTNAASKVEAAIK